MTYKNLVKKYKKIFSRIELYDEKSLRLDKIVILDGEKQGKWLGRLVFNTESEFDDLSLENIEVPQDSCEDQYGTHFLSKVSVNEVECVFNDFAAFADELRPSFPKLRVNNAKFVSYLIENSFDDTDIIKHLPDKLDTQDDYGWTLLMDAISSDNATLVQYLINKNVDLTLVSYKGYTALDQAYKFDNNEIIAMLESYDEKIKLELLCDEADTHGVSL